MAVSRCTFDQVSRRPSLAKTPWSGQALSDNTKKSDSGLLLAGAFSSQSAPTFCCLLPAGGTRNFAAAVQRTTPRRRVNYAVTTAWQEGQ